MMSNTENNQSRQLDPVDTLLTNAFEQALSGPGNQALVNQVMARIARQQRQRAMVLALFGLLASVICMLSAIELLGFLPSVFTGFGGISSEAQLSLPVTAVAVAFVVAGGWLLLEEATA